jgi:hypothetical protein
MAGRGAARLCVLPLLLLQEQCMLQHHDKGRDADRAASLSKTAKTKTNALRLSRVDFYSTSKPHK